MIAFLVAIGVPAANISVDNVLVESSSPFKQVEAIPYGHGERRLRSLSLVALAVLLARAPLTWHGQEHSVRASERARGCTRRMSL